ncbi:hypothetical protein JS80_05255 [Anoxybacillus sp. KU2-6(11)]|nr:hypothetical protein JS80_05255 [Anoxybacillus sp. KU2-6(11)]
MTVHFYEKYKINKNKEKIGKFMYNIASICFEFILEVSTRFNAKFIIGRVGIRQINKPITYFKFKPFPPFITSF